MICEFSEYVTDQGYSIVTCEAGFIYGLGIIIFLLTLTFFISILKK